MSGNERNLTDVVDDTRKLIALFDAIADAPEVANTSAQLHDRDGSLVKTLKAWARERGFDVGYTRYTIEGSRSWDAFRVEWSLGRFISIHDQTSTTWLDKSIENVGGEWSPAQAVAA